MKKIVSTMIGLSCWLGLATTAHADYNSGVVTAPWKTKDVLLSPIATGDRIVISHEAQRTKIHSVEINGFETVYMFENDSNNFDHRGQIESDRAPLVIDLRPNTFISSIRIVAEGWNTPEDGNKFRVEILSGKQSKHGEELSYVAKWTGYQTERLKVDKAKVIKEVQISTSEKTRFHTLELLDEDGNIIDLMRTSQLSSDANLNGDLTIKLASSPKILAVTLNAESYHTTTSGANTEVSIKLVPAKKGRGDKDKRTCSYNGNTYNDGATFNVYVDDRQQSEHCTHGGNKVTTYDIYQPKVCSRGRVRDNGSTFEERSSTVGSCNSAPIARTCTTQRGRTKRDGETWNFVSSRRNERVSRSCGRDFTGSSTDIYEVIINKRCDNGHITDLRDSRGSFIRTDNNCQRVIRNRNCGRRSHLETWSENTRRDRDGTRACGRRDRGKQNVTYRVSQHKRCNNGRVEDTHKSTDVIREGRCVMPARPPVVDPPVVRPPVVRPPVKPPVRPGRCTKGEKRNRQVGTCSRGQKGKIITHEVCNKKGKWRRKVTRSTCHGDGNDNVGGGGDGF